jgi:hypothetical protein
MFLKIEEVFQHWSAGKLTSSRIVDVSSEI